MDVRQKCIEAYERHKHLGLAAQEVGISWQMVYVHLRNSDVPVTGDKARYGTDKDRLAAKAEKSFLEFVPFAEDMNRKKFQSKVDFRVLGFGVDVKASSKKKASLKTKTFKWSFSLKKQELIADFFVCFAYEEDDIKHVFLIPGEIAKNYQSMSVSCSTKCKWWVYEVKPAELADFFKSLKAK
jgi:hypothetical protein